MATIDVIIPNYNYAHFLPECIQRVLSQRIDGIRILVVDNYSTDNSLAVAKQLAEQDDRIEVVANSENLGPHASFNKGIDLTSADYLMILCVDDLLQEGELRRAIEALESSPDAVLAIGPHEAVQPTGRGSENRGGTGWRLTSGTSFIERCCQSYGRDVAAHTILVRTSVQKEVGYYSPSLPFMDDLEMVLRLARRGAVVELDGPLAVQRLQLDCISTALWDNRICDLQEREAVFGGFFARDGADLRRVAFHHRLVRRRLAEAAYWLATAQFCRGEFASGVHLFRYGFRLSPSSLAFFLVGHPLRTRGGVRRIAERVAAPMRRGASAGYLTASNPPNPAKRQAATKAGHSATADRADAG